MRECWPKDEKRRESPSPLAPLVICLLLPLGLPYVNWAIQECCLFYLRSSLWSTGIQLFYFLRLFHSLSFSHRHFGLLFSILTTYQNYDKILIDERRQFRWRKWYKPKAVLRTMLPLNPQVCFNRLLCHSVFMLLSLTKVFILINNY